MQQLFIGLFLAHTWAMCQISDMGQISSVLEWLDKQGDTHFGSNGRLYRTALSRFDSQRVAGEPDSTEWMAANLEVLAERLAKSEHLSGNSLKTYLSRARSALSSYEDWSERPVGWSPNTKRQAESSQRARPRKRAANRAGDRSRETEPELVAPAPQQQSRTLDDEVSEALKAIANWPKLRPYLIEGLAKAMKAESDS